MSTDSALRVLASDARRPLLLPSGSGCEVCGTTDYLSSRGDGVVRCYEHLKGKETIVEDDHIAGRANLDGLTVPLRGNDHRRVTDWRRAVGLDDQPPARGNSVRLVAHVLGGIASLVLLIMGWLFRLADHLDAHAPEWQDDAPPPPFQVEP